ncbi:MAG TPA: LLM class flavin-dependent oxidoreductase, partial [Reyranellaceae bacterium]|nr:LLM class flavin-dependent oxidoreductase [Reyranellaceae bacterium]
GYRPAEFDMFGWPYERRTRAFEETLDILARAWPGERFDYDGKIFKVRGGLLRPPPVRPGRLPLWIGAAHPKARARAVRHRAGFLVAPLAELGLAEHQMKTFDEEAVKQGAGTLPRAIMREVLLGDSAADAMRRHQPYIDHVYRVQYAPERVGLVYIDPATRERKRMTNDDPYYLSEPFMQDRWFLGTPQDIADKIVKWQKRLKLDHFMFTARQPGQTLRHAADDLAAFARQVMPVVRAGLSA